jgi:hypothetical protein
MLIMGGYTHFGKPVGVNGVWVGAVGHEVQAIDGYGNLSGAFNNDGIVYHVDVNSGVDTNDGLTWDTAFKTYAKAVSASNLTISASPKGTGRGWAARNTIFYKGDNKEADAETLITLPNKCDVIGVGSYDHRPMPMMIGNHVIGAGAYAGTRFFNMGFMSPAAGGAIFTVPTTTSGLAFYGCHFDGRSATAATIGISATAVEQLTIQGCRFFGKYSTATISIGAGSGRLMLIKDNIIESGAIGITVSATYTCVDGDGMILNNFFDVATLVVEDLSDTLYVSGNRGSTDSNGSLDETFDTNALFCSDNVFSCSAGTQSYYPAYAAIPA